jgi:hypothetical protein
VGERRVEGGVIDPPGSGCARRERSRAQSKSIARSRYLE